MISLWSNVNNCTPSVLPSLCQLATQKAVPSGSHFLSTGSQGGSSRLAAAGLSLQPLWDPIPWLSPTVTHLTWDQSPRICNPPTWSAPQTGWELMLVIQNFLKVKCFCKDHRLLRLIISLFIVVIFGIACLRVLLLEFTCKFYCNRINHLGKTHNCCNTFHQKPIYYNFVFLYN